MRKIIYGIVLLCMVGALAYPFINVDKDVAMLSIDKEVMPFVDKKTMVKQDHKYIRRYYQTNDKEYEEVLVYASISAMNVEEISAFKVKDHEKRKVIKSRIINHQEAQRKSFEGYGVKQTELLKQAIILEKGDYIIFIVHPEGSKLKQILSDLF
ncbi:MAG: DUF4358 domain-containing protein [Erysipelotrichaceae bacterium]